MDSKELKKEIVDEKTGISYTLVGDYYMPNLYLEPEKKITLNKYGLLRLNYLKKHKKAEYSILFINKQTFKRIARTSTKGNWFYNRRFKIKKWFNRRYEKY